MSEYVVIKKFTDKEDKHKYAVGDRYPYRGFAKKERIEELSTKKNLRGIPVIKEKDAKKAETVEEKKTSEVKEEKTKRSSKK